MNKKLLSSLVVAITAFSSVGTASAQEALTGDTRLACEAILCLSSGTRPGECTPSLSRYFGISHRKFSDTIKARLNFLNLCPVSNQSTEMQSLVSAISRGAGRCDVDWFNEQLRSQRERRVCNDYSCKTEIYFVISDKAPSYCAAYTGHAYTDFATTTLPTYVGTPENGGYWVEAKNYETALAEYNAKQEEQRNKKNWWQR